MEHTISKSQKRKHIINSILFIFLIFSLLFSKNSQGYETTISDFWNNCRKIKFLLPQKETICTSTFTQARSKLNETICNLLNKSIISAYEEETNRWNNQRICAIDGSKINLLHELIKVDKKTENKLKNILSKVINCDFEVCLRNEKKALFKSYYVHNLSNYVHNLSNKNHKL